MKMIITEQELEAMPDAVRQNVDEDDDGNYVFEGEATGIVEDVSGLKSALEKERDGRKEAEDKLRSTADQSTASKKELADANMKVAIAEADGNVHVMPSVIREAMVWDDDLGEYIVPAEDGQPLRKDDSTLKSVSDVVADMKKNSKYGSLFKGTSHSGGGSPPGIGGGAGKALAANQDNDGLPPLTTSRRSMTREQKVAIINAGEDLDRWPL